MLYTMHINDMLEECWPNRRYNVSQSMFFSWLDRGYGFGYIEVSSSPPSLHIHMRRHNNDDIHFDYLVKAVSARPPHYEVSPFP